MLIHLKRALILGMILAGASGPLHAMDSEKNRLNEELLVAAAAGKTNEVTNLLNSGAEVNYQNEYGDTALIEATIYSHPEIIRLLIEKGVNVYLQNKLGRTALRETRLTEISKILVTAMLKLTKEQKDSIYALIASLEKSPTLKTSKDIRNLIVQKLIDAYKKENREKTRTEIEKIKIVELRKQLLEFMEK